MSFTEQRELRRLLDRLTPAKRIAWLRWCCRQVSQPGFAGTKVMESDGSTEAVLWDALSLKVMFGLSLERMGTELVQRVRARV